MKFSMWSSFLIELSPYDAVKKFAEHGFQYTELSYEHIASFLQMEHPDKAAKLFRAYCDDLEFKIPQGHLIFPKFDLATNDPQARAVYLDRWKRELEIFEILGVEQAILHPGGDVSFGAGISISQIQDVRLSALRELTDFTKNMTIQVCLENMCHMGCYMATSSDLLETIQLLGADNIGICLDTGHLNIRKTQSHGDFIRACGKRLKALHIADNHGFSDEHLLPYGGSVNWPEVNEALNEIGYDRLYNLEVPGERVIPMELKGAKLDYAHALCRTIFHRK